MNRQKIIEAIQNQKMIIVHYRKENGGEFDNREIAPFDLFPKEDKEGNMREKIWGYFYGDFNKRAGDFSTYLDNINNIEILKEDFNGSEVRRLLNWIGKSMTIQRNW